jgi:hypothetical protein
MTRRNNLTHRFVELIPEQIEDGVLFVSLQFATAVHNCCCGCGNRVVTPLKPVSWQLTFDGESVSLYPSIGNWSFPCRSHYWISNDTVEWSYQMADSDIQAGRRHDKRLRAAHLEGNGINPVTSSGKTRASRLPKWLRRLLH